MPFVNGKSKNSNTSNDRLQLSYSWPGAGTPHVDVYEIKIL